MTLPSRKIAVVAATGALAVTIGGVAYADTGTGHAAKQTAGTRQVARARMHRHPLLRRTLHGSFVLRTKPGKTVTVDIQRGTVTAVSSTSLTVRSRDGVSETYVLDAATKIRSRGRAVPASRLTTGDRGFVVATETDAGKVARAIRGVRMAKGAGTS
jgi:hypothetical protein